MRAGLRVYPARRRSLYALLETTLMPKPFDPIRLLKEISNDLLRELFTREGAKLRIPWDELSRNDIAPILLVWETMPQSERWKIHVALQEVHEMSHEPGLRVLAEQIDWLRPELISAFSAWEGRVDKVLWAWMHARDAFDEAAIFARADALAVGRYWKRWNGLPPEPITVTEKHTSRLQDELRKYYWPKELRGRHCRVHHYPRCSGVDYFFAYLDDWPDKLLAFDENGKMTSCSERYAFTNVFAYDPDNGCIDLIAKGGRKVHSQLRQAFCRSVLELEVEDEQPLLPAYRLDHLLEPHLSLVTDPADRIASVRINRIRIVPKDVKQKVRYEEIGFTTHTTLNMVSTELRERLADQNLLREQVSVSQVSFQLQFHSDGRSRPRTMTFHVRSPNSCDLKSKSEELRAIGERCRRLWRVTDA